MSHNNVLEITQYVLGVSVFEPRPSNYKSGLHSLPVFIGCIERFFSQAFYHLVTWLPHYHTATWQLTGPPSPVVLSCVDKPSSFSGNSPNLTAPFLLILFYPWQKKGSSPQNDTCPSYSLAIQQNLSFSLHWFSLHPHSWLTFSLLLRLVWKRTESTNSLSIL